MGSQSKLVSFEDGAEMLGLHHTTVRQRKAGTEMLTHVPGLALSEMSVHLLAYHVGVMIREMGDDAPDLWKGVWQVSE